MKRKPEEEILLASLSASEPRDPVCGLLGRVSGSRGVTESLFLLSSTEPLFLLSSTLSSTQPLFLLSLQVLSTVLLSLTEPLFLCHGTKVTEPLITHSHILTHLCRVPFSPTACQGRSPRQKKAASETGTLIWKSLCSQRARAIHFVHSNLKCT